MFIICLAGILYLFPRDLSLVLDYQEGQTWLEEDLRAPFDYPILKTDEELEAEQERLEQAFIPIFKYQDSVKQEWITCWHQRKQSSLELVLQDPMQLRFFENYSEDSITSFYDQVALNAIDSIAKHFLVEPHEANENDVSIRVMKDRSLFQLQSDEYLHLTDAVLMLKEWAQLNEQAAWVYQSLEQCLSYNTFYSDSLNSFMLNQAVEQLPTALAVMDKGSLIIERGQVIRGEELRALYSLEKALQARSWQKEEKWLILLGQGLLLCTALLMLALFLFTYRKEIFHNNASIAFLLLNMYLMILMAAVFASKNPDYIYIAPFCILPLMIRAFFDTRLALYTHLITILIMGFLVPRAFEFLFIQLIAGCVATLTAVSLHKRADLFLTVGKIALVYLITYIGLSLIQHGSLNSDDAMVLGLFVANAGLTLFAFPLVYLYEKVFGMVSDISLLELSDTNTPLLRALNQQAPGTFQHSLQVANLAEAAVQELGGNTLLMRAGALYHDIGKMEEPQYFIENQITGVNPHDDLSFEESAKVIINHVIRGIEMAKEHKLPDRLIDFIRTHHGTTMVQYFYRQYIKTFPDEIVDKERFSYPGPKPFSMETAILMMTDAVEAASRSLDEKSEKNISNLVDKIIDSQMDEGQFDNVDLTLRDIERIKKIFKRKLISIYHVRVAYPD